MRKPIVLVTLVLTGCAVAPEQTAVNRAPLSTSPAVFPNAVKYRDDGLKPATGRAGAAQLTARALLSNDGSTEVELSTGELDTTAAPGALERVQLKVLDSEGKILEVLNDSPNVAVASYRHSGLWRGQELRVQANVSGIDPSRTDVVAVVEHVKRRPDLSVQPLAAPARAVVGTNVVITASILEKAGDVGVRTDCVLAVDGAEVDRAEGIWVDAGGKVSCAFSHAFTTVGAHAVRVFVERTTPRDDDPVNDAQSTTIDVAAPVETVATMSYLVASDTSQSQYALQEWWYTAVGARLAGRAETSQVSTEQTTYFTSSGAARLTFPMTIDFADATDSTPLGAFAATLHPTFVQEKSDKVTGDWSRYDCAHAYLPSATLLEVCSGEAQKKGVLHPSTWVTANRMGGDVTYHSRQFGLVWGQDVGFIQNSWTRHNPAIKLGNTYDARLSLTDGARELRGGGAVTLDPFEWSSEKPYSCSLWRWPDGLAGNFCDMFRSSSRGRRGFASVLTLPK